MSGAHLRELQALETMHAKHILQLKVEQQTLAKEHISELNR